MEVHHHAHSSGPDPSTSSGPRGLRKKWAHYFWEFLMLFLAVFCGFLAEYQLEHKIEKDREKQFMLTMAEDLRSDSAQLYNLIMSRKSRVRELDTLFHIIANDEYLTNGRKVYELYEFPYWDIYRFFPSDRTMQQLKNGGNMRLIRKQSVSNALIKYDLVVRNYKEYEPLQVELATQINQHLEKLLDPLIIENAAQDFTEKQLVADTFLVGKNGSRNLPPVIPISKLTDADKKIFLKYINQVKTIYLQYLRDHMTVKKLAQKTLAIVTKEYNIK